MASCIAPAPVLRPRAALSLPPGAVAATRGRDVSDRHFPVRQHLVWKRPAGRGSSSSGGSGGGGGGGGGDDPPSSPDSAAGLPGVVQCSALRLDSQASSRLRMSRPSTPVTAWPHGDAAAGRGAPAASPRRRPRWISFQLQGFQAEICRNSRQRSAGIAGRTASSSRAMAAPQEGAVGFRASSTAAPCRKPTTPPWAARPAPAPARRFRAAPRCASALCQHTPPTAWCGAAPPHIINSRFIMRVPTSLPASSWVTQKGGQVSFSYHLHVSGWRPPGRARRLLLPTAAHAPWPGSHCASPCPGTRV